MEIIYLIIAVLIVYVIFFRKSNPKDQVPKATSHAVDTRVIDKRNLNKRTPGMYFMELYEVCERQRKMSDDSAAIQYFEYASDFYNMLGCACQGRIEDIDDVYNEVINEDSVYPDSYIELLKNIKKDVYSMAKIALRIDESDMMDMKGNESVGEYADRKLLASKRFMEKYNYFLDFDFLAFYDQKIKEELTPIGSLQ